MKAIRTLVGRVKKTGAKRPGTVSTVAMGRKRSFSAWDVGDDTYIFEKGIAGHLGENPSVLVVGKGSLKRGTAGRILTMTTGNHSVAAFPLLDGRFWGFSHLAPSRRGKVLMEETLCANVVDGKLEISQRDVPPAMVFAADAWLTGPAGLSIADVVMGERNDATIEHYRRLGQEWRVKPLARTEAGMKTALAASAKRISSKIVYYHSAKGVHFLTYPEFERFARLANDAPEDFVQGLKELVSVYEGNRTSFTRMPKHRGHHEIEFFGLVRGVGVGRLVPELEKLMEAIVLGRIGRIGMVQKAEEAAALFASLLSRPEMADEKSHAFVESLYMNITGEVYAIAGEGSTPAFDDRRTALPGATFVNGRPVFHPGADDRSEVLLSNIRGFTSKDERIEYANVYELGEETADGETRPAGKGSTREIVYKTDRCPLEQSLVEKLLSRAKRGYSSYMLARVQAFKALGIALSEYRILRRRAHAASRLVDVYIRRRCEGEPLDSIPANYFRDAADSSVEDPSVVLALAVLMGDAAAQNMAMKKFDPATGTPLFGAGKEIYEFEYDIAAGRTVPARVSTCSVRASLGWQCLDYTDENLEACFSFYLKAFAKAFAAYSGAHPSVDRAEAASAFMDGFERRTRSMEWRLSMMRDRFESFRPGLPPVFGFEKKWLFAMWALERQERRLASLRARFMELVSAEGAETAKDETEE